LIREAVKALVEIVLPIGELTTGGHPAITPLIALFVQEAGLPANRLNVYQSEYFAGQMPGANRLFANVHVTPKIGEDRDASLTLMRRVMIESQRFDAAVVIGGMEGVFEEVEIFSQVHSPAPILPVASTGAAAAEIFRRGNFRSDLAKDLTYPTLFRRHLLGGLQQEGRP
jgi:hypothetical protein